VIQHVGVIGVERTGVARDESQALVGSFQELHADVLGPHFDCFPDPRFLLLGDQVRQGVALRVVTVHLAEVVRDGRHAVLHVRTEVGIDVLLETAAHLCGNVAMPRFVLSARQVQGESLRIDRRRDEQTLGAELAQVVSRVKT